MLQCRSNVYAFCKSEVLSVCNTAECQYFWPALRDYRPWKPILVFFWVANIKTGLLYFIAIHTRFFNKCSILETACKCSVLTETNCHFKRTTEFHEPPLDRPLTLLEVMQFREIAGIPVWQQSWVQIDKKTETKISIIFISIVFPCVLCAHP